MFAKSLAKLCIKNGTLYVQALDKPARGVVFLTDLKTQRFWLSREGGEF